MKAELIKKEGNVVNFKLTIDNDKFEAAPLLRGHVPVK